MKRYRGGERKRGEESGRSALNSKSGSEQLEKRVRADTNIRGQKYLETEDRDTKDGEIFAESILKPFPAGF